MLSKDEEWLLKEKYEGVESKSFRADCERLSAGEPLGYVIGHIPFLDCTIYLDSKPLIPRVETEYWVEKAIAVIKHPAPRVLDLCAGSGAIDVSIAKAIPEAQVDLVELDENHHDTIKRNLEANVTDLARVRIIGGDLFENVKQTYDYILTNPPYIDPAIDRAEESVKSHEPHLALYGGAKGMEIIDRIIATAPDYLNEGGELWVEHEPEQVEAIKAGAEAAGFSSVAYPDQYGILRYSVLKSLKL